MLPMPSAPRPNAHRLHGIACRGPVLPVTELLAHQGQVLARQDGMARSRVAQLVQAQPAESDTGAYHLPVVRGVCGLEPCGTNEGL